MKRDNKKYEKVIGMKKEEVKKYKRASRKYALDMLREKEDSLIKEAEQYLLDHYNIRINKK